MTPIETYRQRGTHFPVPAQSGVTSAKVPASPAFYFTLMFVFVVYARFPEITDLAVGASLHSARIIMALSLLAALLFGASLRPIFSKIGICFIGFTAWLCICTPFSIWRGGSAGMLREFWLLAMFSFVLIAATVRGLEQCRKLMYTLAAAAVFIEAFAIILGRAQGGRIALLGGTLGNANYLAMMLLMGLPFCLFVIRAKPGLSLLKFLCLLTLLSIPVTVVATGSRGGLITLIVMFLLYFVTVPSSQKMVVAIVVMIVVVFSISWAGRSALERYKTIFINSDSGGVRLTGAEESALEASDLRKELLFSSLRLTIRHPLLGVGPGMFAVANAHYLEVTTGHSNSTAWYETHNTFTQLSCEDGLPGLFLYCLALFFCFKTVRSARKLARQNPALSTVGHMAFALQLALIAFTGTALFASNAYAYYFPMLASVCVVLERGCAELTSSGVPVSALAENRPPAAGAWARLRPAASRASKSMARNRPASGSADGPLRR
jgi:O-antigen ligase